MLYFKIRNIILKFLYKIFLKRLFFVFNPEFVHDCVTIVGNTLGRFSITRSFTKYLFFYENEVLQQKIFGINFPNPVGLAAGFDKNAELIHILPSIGFGYEEVGSITAKKCIGNKKPRLWRLLKSKSLLVYYGLKNDGIDKILPRLVKKVGMPLGISIAKTNDENVVSELDGIKDYKYTYDKCLQNNAGDYITINISCPNTFGGEPFTDKDKLDRLLNELFKDNKTKPVFLKLPAELDFRKLDELVSVAIKYKIDGIVSTNLAKNRSNKFLQDKNIPDTGGMSGKVVEDLSNKQIAYLYKNYGQELIIIGCGGIFSAEDAYKKIRLGSSLVQLITGMIFEGPQLIGEINYGLVRLLKKDGFSSITEVVGVDSK